MVVQHNLSAENALRNNGYNTGGLSKSLEKLSSGFKINRAGDNAAGLAVSEKMRAQLRGIEQAVNNAQDGISMVQTFEGALTESHNILNRIKTLAAQSANGTYDDQVDRAAIELEYEQLIQELDDISDTDFNGVRVLNLDGAGSAAPLGATHTADLSALSGTDFSTQLKDDLWDLSYFWGLSAEYEAPADPVELSGGGEISFAYSIAASSYEIVFDVMQGGKSIGKGVYSFEDYVYEADVSVSLTGTGGEDFGKIKLNFSGTPSEMSIDVYVTEEPVINPTALDELADAITAMTDGDAVFEISYTPPDLPAELHASITPEAKTEDYIPKNFMLQVYDQATKNILISTEVDMTGGFHTVGNVRLIDFDSVGKSIVIDGKGLGKFTVTYKSGTIGNVKPDRTREYTSAAPFSSLNLEKIIHSHPGLAQTTISGMSAAPTEIVPAVSAPVTAATTTTTATGVSLQVGARTKDLKEYDFEYEGVWGGGYSFTKICYRRPCRRHKLHGERLRA
jgi:flagellin-like hook-associated protein FlgL